MKKFKDLVLITLLFLKNAVLLRKLLLHHACVLDAVHITGCELNVVWHVRGCHRISVNGHHNIPGNIGGVILLNPIPNEKYAVKFHGLFKTVTAPLRVSHQEVKLLKNFSTTSILPDHNKAKLSTKLEPSNIHLNGFIKPKDVVLRINQHHIAFDPFVIEKYQAI
jgi:hypothetical protein